MVRLKGTPPLRPPALPAHFNSTMVRLKVAKMRIKPYFITFQFHYGTIKSFDRFVIMNTEFYFNSTMVRLKVAYPTIGAVPVLYFNSTMVRLKDVVTNGKGITILFQFHYGTIKRRTEKPDGTVTLGSFQFHYGTIKSKLLVRL